MSEVFLPSGVSLSQVSDGVAATLIGNYYPSIDQYVNSGLGLVTPWGGGILSRLTSSDSEAAGAGTSSDQSSAMLDMVQSLAASRAPVTNYNFQGLIGPPGTPGTPGLPGFAVSLPGSTGAQGEPGQLLLVAEQPKFDGTFQSNTPTAGKVAWTGGILTYKTIEYTITADATGTVDDYIYWDLNDDPTIFHSTADRLQAIGTDRWIICFNDDGDAYAVSSDQMIPGTIIIDGTVLSDALAENAVTTAKLDALAVTTSKIATSAITASKILAGEIGTAHLGALTITGDKIAANAVTSSKILAGEIGANHIAAGAITAGKLAANSVVAANIVAGTITANQMAAATITAASGVIADLAVGTLQIANNAVTQLASTFTETGQPLTNNVWVTIAEFSFTATGVSVIVSGNTQIKPTGIVPSTDPVQLRITRQLASQLSVVFTSQSFGIPANSCVFAPMTIVDVPAAGSQTYRLQAKWNTASSGTMYAYMTSLFAMERKK